jgi:UDP-N-acetylmuramyl tripeptide synthase
LRSFADAGAGRIFTVFGCDGEVGSSQARARMGEVAHTNSDFVIVTNASPRMEDPAAIVEDIVSGFPDEVTEPYAAYVYNPFQDQNNVPLWFEPFLHSAQRHKRR